MSASVPWSVNAVEPEAWAAAREAARRSGLSVGEWLEAAIRENAGEVVPARHGRRRAMAAPAPDDRLEDIAEQLDELISRAPDFTQANQQTARVNAGIHRSLNALNDRIEALMAGVRMEPKIPTQLQATIERMEAVLASARAEPKIPLQLQATIEHIEALLANARAEPKIPPQLQSAIERIEVLLASARAEPKIPAQLELALERIEALMAGARAEPKIPTQLQSAIERLDTRLEELIETERAPAAAPPEVERKLADIEQSIEVMSARLEQETERNAASVAELDAAVAEITVHQSTLDGEAPNPDLARRFAAIHASLEQNRRENQFTELEQQFRSMVDEVHALRRDGAQAEGVEAVRREVAELSGRLADVAPRRSLEALEGAVDSLAQRIDRTGDAGNDNLAQIVDALKLIRQALSEVQPAESFAAVERDLQGLSTKLDALGSMGVDHLAVARLQAEAGEIREVLANALPSDALKALVEQIELLVSKFERVANSGDATVRDVVGALEQRIDGIAGQLQSAAQNAPNTTVLESIGTRIDALQRAFDHGGSRLNGGLETMLQRLADKVDGAQARLSNLDSIERELNSLSSGLREVRTSVTEVAEHAARSAVRELAAGVVAAKPTARPTPLPEVIPAAVERTPVPTVTFEPALAARTVSAEPIVRPEQPIERPASALDSELPADFPLEPGSGGPRARGVQSAAERVALSEAALGAFAPKAAQPEPSTTSDFIAAARRAAQAANAETAQAPETKRTDLSALWAATSRLLSAADAKTRRTVAIGLVSMLLVYGAVRYYDVFLPYLFTFSSKPNKVSELSPQIVAPPPAAKPIEPTAEIVPPVEPAAQNQVEARDTENRDFAGVPPAGMLASQPPPPPIESAVEPQVTGSTTPIAPVRVSAPPTAAVVPAQPSELPPGLGTAALRNAALAGDPAAAYEIGARWFDGRGVNPNAQEAQRWFERAIAKGSMHAAYRLGTMHEKGQGIPKNLNEARRLYLMAAEAGHAKAMHNLAVLHAEGIDGKPDMRAAARWFRLAADRGVRDSQYNLGVMYARGAGVTQNLAESYRWFALAAMQGDSEAAKKRDDVASRLDAQTLVAAKLAVQTWTATLLDATVNDVQIKPEWQTAEVVPTPRKKPTKN